MAPVTPPDRDSTLIVWRASLVQLKLGGWLGKFLPGVPKMPYDEIEAEMSTREVIARELDNMPEQDLDKLLAFLRLLKEVHAEAAMPALAAESSLAKDWLTPEEDAAWANL